PMPAPVMSRSYAAGPRLTDAAEQTTAPANRLPAQPAPAVQPPRAQEATSGSAAAVPQPPTPLASSVAAVFGVNLPPAIAKAASLPAAPHDTAKPPASGDDKAAPASLPGARKAENTVDDALTELLRPIVRQWLDENMMRALENAVRVEVADSVKNGAAKPK